VFTEEMAFVMGGRGSEDFEKFQDYCTKAYNLIRKKGYHLISLFIMMIVAGKFSTLLN
jgi:phosphatidylinositol-4,5-bisphosphate 3-kinase